MTEEFALTYIPVRMRELGKENKYQLQYRHLYLQPNEIREINAYSQFFFLIGEPDRIMITSEMGLYDLTNRFLNELLYEHQGLITVTNLTSAQTSVKFIQVIVNND